MRRADVNGKSQLLRGLDGNKDQSYFLYTLSHEQIAQSLFPVGELEKPQVRKIAEELDLITAKKKDSTGICFIGERKFRDFLGRYLPAQPGKIVTVDGDEIGQHQGLMYHTLGQRKGLGIGGTKEGSEDPWYVVDKDVENNILVVAQGHDHPRLMSVGLIAQQLHWVDREPLKGTLRCTVKTRYRQTDIPCTVTALDDERIDVRFDEPVAAVTPASPPYSTAAKSVWAAGSLNSACRCRPFNTIAHIKENVWRRTIMTSPRHWLEFASLPVWCNSWRIRVIAMLTRCTFHSTALSTSTPVRLWVSSVGVKPIFVSVLKLCLACLTPVAVRG